jgi:hypothetical protein
MARASFRILAPRAAAAILAAGLLCGYLGSAAAQESKSGWLDTDCAKLCASKGYEAGFCDNVCWVPDPAAAAKGDKLDWKCFEACTARGSRTEPCLASCRVD